MKSGARILLPLVVFFAFILSGCATGKKTGGNSGIVKPLSEESKTLSLSIGPDELKDKYVTLERGQIYDSNSGTIISFDQLIDYLMQKQVIYLGESHTSMAIHKFQARVLAALLDKGANLKIGMEFFQRKHFHPLLDWSNDWLTEKGLLYKTGWYEKGGYNYGYYRPIMEIARKNEIPVLGINIPRSILRVISSQGLDNLSPEMKEVVGEVDTSNADHRTLIMSFFGGMGGGAMMHGDKNSEAAKAMLDRYYTAQCAWDSVFADSVISAMSEFDGKVVVIVGSGHVAYNVGTNRVLAGRSDLTQSTVLPVPVDSDAIATKVARTYADYLYGIEDDVDPAYFPSFGLSVAEEDAGLKVGMLMPGSAVKEAGIDRGDIIISVDGLEFKDVTALKIYLAEKRWGSATKFQVSRGGALLDYIVELNK